MMTYEISEMMREKMEEIRLQMKRLEKAFIVANDLSAQKTVQIRAIMMGLDDD